MFSLWTGCVQSMGLGLYNQPVLYTQSTETVYLSARIEFLYHQTTQAILQLIHYFFSRITGKVRGLYPQSTKPITTTILYKGGRK